MSLNLCPNIAADDIIYPHIGLIVMLVRYKHIPQLTTVPSRFVIIFHPTQLLFFVFFKTFSDFLFFLTFLFFNLIYV